MKQWSRNKKSAVIKFWRSKEKYTVSDNNTSALLYDSTHVCVYFIVDSVIVSYLICYDSLLQNGQILLQNATAILLQSATEVYYKMRQVFITKCDSYYKLRQFYCKMRRF